MSDGRLLNAPLEGLSKTKDDGVRGQSPDATKMVDAKAGMSHCQPNTFRLTRLRPQEKR